LACHEQCDPQTTAVTSSVEGSHNNGRRPVSRDCNGGFSSNDGKRPIIDVVHIGVRQSIAN